MNATTQTPPAVIEALKYLVGLERLEDDDRKFCQEMLDKAIVDELSNLDYDQCCRRLQKFWEHLEEGGVDFKEVCKYWPVGDRLRKLRDDLSADKNDECVEDKSRALKNEVYTDALVKLYTSSKIAFHEECKKIAKITGSRISDLEKDIKFLASVELSEAEAINESAKWLKDCPYVTVSEEGAIQPNRIEIAGHLIKKFDLMAISNEDQEEGLSLWRRSEKNEYRPISKNIQFMIKEMQTVMDGYHHLSTLVNERWINLVEILRQAQVKRIVPPARGMFPMANGIYDIVSKKLVTIEDGNICLVRSRTNFDPDAKCPNFDNFLIDIFSNNTKKIGAFLSWIGSIIAGMNPQIIVLMKSRGRSGKGVLMDIMSEILGSMLTTMSPNLLHERFTNWGFFQKRLVYLEEHDGKDASVRAMKEISGGVSAIPFEVKGQQAIMEAPVQSAVWLVTNNPPPYEKGSAWEERLKVLDFPNSYVDSPKASWEKPKDTGLETRLNKELAGIFNKLLPYAEYALDHPDKMFRQDIPYRDIEKSLDRSTYSLENFINEYCELAPMKNDSYNNYKVQYNDGFTVTDTTFMKKYEDYCASADVNVRASASLFVKKTLKSDYKVIIRGHNMMGIALKKG